MKQVWMKFAGVLVAALLAAPAGFADTSSRASVVPGTVNYVEGQVSIGNDFLNSKSVGSALVEQGQSLTTETGKTEMLLTPGVFLRLGDHSSARMVSSSLTNTQVALNRGEAMVEVDEIHPQNDIRVAENGATTRLLKTGLYDFDASHNLVRVIDGKAVVRENDHDVTVKSGHELALADTGKLKADKFDKKNFETTDLYRWSSLRSDYVANANVDAARLYYVNGWYGPGWVGPGWYWDPWFAGYTFIPGNGIFYNPFGWGFYSPLWAYRAPFFYRGRFGTAPVRVAHDPAPIHNRSVSSPPMAHNSGFAGAPRSFNSGGGFHSFAGGGMGGRR